MRNHFSNAGRLNLARYGRCAAGIAALCATSAFAGTASTIALTAANANGSANNGSVTLGSTITFSTILTNLANNPARAWALQGEGALALQGTGNGWAIYTAPSIMPSNAQIIVTASVSTDPTVTTSYTFKLTNPVPGISNSNPSEAAAGSAVPVTLTGNGFVPGTVIRVNGAAVAATYQSPASIVAQISAVVGSSNALSIQAENPSPGGGTSAAFTLQTECLQLAAKDADGTNTGIARLGEPVTVSTVLTNIPSNPTRSWKMTGAGTLAVQAAGEGNGWAIYTPPPTIPANSNVTITVTAGTNPVATATYSFSIGNPIPLVTSSTPAQLLSGATQTLTLTGTGFLPSTTVQFKGVNYPIAYSSPMSATVRIPVPATLNDTTLTLHAQNPLPGGGSTVFMSYIPADTITLTAADGDGINTGTADLGLPVTMSAAVTGSALTAVNWSLSGAGTLSSSGVYTPPLIMPGSTAVTIRAKLTSNPTVEAVYSLNIVNPSAIISDANPYQVPSGRTTPVMLTGTGFLPSTTILVNGQTVGTNYVSATQIIAHVTAAANLTGNLSLQGKNPTPGGGIGPEFEEAVTTAVSATTAARLLDQTTFGPTTSLIQHVQNEGVTGWLAEQYNTPQTFLPTVPMNFPSYCGDAEHCVESEWWQTVLTGNDQLRQRVAFALSELFVVSSNNVSGWGIQNYHNLLAADAFSNWYTIMNDVTRSPAMGIYLNMVNSRAAPPGQIANENFARENMQLFNIGLNRLNQDGTPQLDANGNPIPAYTESQVQAFARVFTGWTFANADGSSPAALNNPVNYYAQLLPVESTHDENSKTLLDGTTLPAGQTAEQDLSQGLANVFGHPSLPPFVCKQLIQHLVKSDPSPAYVDRVATVFVNDGNGVRGDMQAVLTAIFTDYEARAGDTAAQPSDGHLREPILWMTAVMRGLGFANVDPDNYYQYLSDDTNTLNQVPYQSPSVFNFFPPGYVIPGTTLVAPEFALENTANAVDLLTLADTVVNNDLWNFNVDLSATSPLGKIEVSQGPAPLVSALSNLFLYGTMDANTSTAITDQISLVADPAQRVRLAAYLVITSSPYKILH